ncbi:YqiA/YcfP family alpha/beta fold hydrolase [Bermanella sp. WJH001]|uniref:YqiA/YcfP family alpha/beta fold hydrolase n=1 Tax=Bermanella sp. WJH001 TaxID=3048005 RepID=UPI0024BE2C86|nr:YqiA/YcfP family alpha/beta fold hydrolase [Bermanella sp. WJH001]MDJ1539064.1 YqiA/YcfP family alpha/beta fold hydrolase [Bermanella sp. WJH001]
MIPETLRCLYLHGFKSGPSSVKAQQTLHLFAEFDVAQNLHIPQLSPEPARAIDEAQFLYEQLIDEVGVDNCLIIGSSLGGYYASYLVERFGGRAALINPAVRPYELLQDYLGENENLYNGEKFIVTPSYLTELLEIEVMPLKQPKHHFLLVKTHDETLDAMAAVKKYQASPSIIEYGGNHSYDDYPKRLPSIINFATQPY